MSDWAAGPEVQGLPELQQAWLWPPLEPWLLAGVLQLSRRVLASVVQRQQMPEGRASVLQLLCLAPGWLGVLPQEPWQQALGQLLV